MAFSNSNSGGSLGSGLEGLVANKFSINKELGEGILNDKLFLNALILSFIFFVLQIGVLLFRIKQLPPYVPLYYSKPWGDEIMATKTLLSIIPILSFVFTVLNFSIGRYFFSKDKFVLRILAGLTCVLSFSSFWVIFKITSLLI